MSGRGAQPRRASARPGHIEQHVGYTSKTIEIWGHELDRATAPARTVGDVRRAVRAFGDAIRARDPDSSFAVLVIVRRGDRRPPGFDAAHHSNGFGQDDFLQVQDHRPEPAAQASAPADSSAPIPPAAE